MKTMANLKSKTNRGNNYSKVIEAIEKQSGLFLFVGTDNEESFTCPCGGRGKRKVILKSAVDGSILKLGRHCFARSIGNDEKYNLANPEFRPILFDASSATDKEIETAKAKLGIIPKSKNDKSDKVTK